MAVSAGTAEELCGWKLDYQIIILRLYASTFWTALSKLAAQLRLLEVIEGLKTRMLQRYSIFFRGAGQDEFAGDRSFCYGKSISNQRIEAWWSFLRRECADWWINYFKDVRERGIYNDGNNIHVECLKFCFSDLIQKELQRVARLWNLRKIRPSTNADLPDGRPDIMYHIPLATGTRDFGYQVSEEEIQIARGVCAVEGPASGCLQEFNTLAGMIMQENELVRPNDKEAEELYLVLLRLIEDIF